MDGKILLLNGGGLDSIAQLIIANDRGWNITSLHIDYGQDASLSELLVARSVAQETGTELHSIQVDQTPRFVNGGIISEAHKPLVPSHDLTSKEVKSERAGYEMEGRNLMLFGLALAWAAQRFDWIMFANNTAPAYFPDATQRFILRLNEMCMFLGTKVRVTAPFANLSKVQAVGVAYRINKRVLEAHSCYKAKECGVCPHCIQKQEVVKACVG